MNRVVWENVRGPRALLATVIATALGAGLIPLAPGTWGTIIALPLAYVSIDWSWPLRLLLWLVILVVGTWSATTFDDIMRTGDNQCIVIDEVLGLGITSWTADHSLKSWIAAFVLFRVFDVLKPFPIRAIDVWSKKKAISGPKSGLAKHWGGFGVMADDMLAAFEALAVIAVLQGFKILS